MKNKIIEDLKNTISRLQTECTEKSNLIFALTKKLEAEKHTSGQFKKILDKQIYTQFKIARERTDYKKKLEKIEQENLKIFTENFLSKKPHAHNTYDTITIHNCDVANCDNLGVMINDYNIPTYWCNKFQGSCEYHKNKNCKYKQSIRKKNKNND
jgi:hypothetical protein